MRVVLDSNVLLSALAGHPNSPSGRLLVAVRQGLIEAVACPMLLDEVSRGLTKPYFAARVSADEGAEAVAAIQRVVTILPDPEGVEPALRDSGDDYLVALARTGHADAIVTGDADLLEHPDLRIAAITPAAVCEELGL